MNGFINKYRWVIVIVAGAIAAGVAFYSQQDGTPIEVSTEKTDTAATNTVAEESKELVTEAAEKVEEVVEPTEEAPTPEVIETAEPEPEVEATPVPEAEPEPEVVVVEDEAVEETAEEVVETEETATEEVAEEIVETPVSEPVEETTEEVTPTETAEAELVVIEAETEAVPEPEPTPEPTAEPEAEAVEEIAEPVSEATEVVEGLAGTITATSETETGEGGAKPTFDVVRVDPTGSAVIAGTAEPYSKVVILSNGVEIGEAIAGANGEFVAIIQVPENEQGQTLELESEVAGQLLFSDETILILPIMRSDAANTVSEESAPPIIRASAEDVVIIQGAPQLALGQVSLDSISYDENDEVVLAGRGNPGHTIIIYVDDAPLMDTVVSDSGSWKQALHGLDAGRYVLRVDEVDSDGKVTSRVESPFQREYPEDVREAKASNETTYTVQPGNSLWVIATGRYGDGLRYHQIFSANKDQIRDPDLIYPGQVFAIPETE